MRESMNGRRNVMSDPIEMLMQEHRLFEQVLDSLDALARAAAEQKAVDRKTVASFAEFFRDFADRCHHGKEENHLFVELAKHGMPEDSGPVGVMRHEHETGRALVREMALFGQGDEPLEAEEKGRLSQVAAGFSEHLRMHIQKEDQILFPMARRVLPPAILGEIGDRFRAFERDEMGEGVQEAMREKAGTLKAS
jgi:hemerythrin-like domain-containing protein